MKVLGEELFDATEPLIRVDMTEYMEKHSVSKLIGSPPGYVGFDEAGSSLPKGAPQTIFSWYFFERNKEKLTLTL